LPSLATYLAFLAALLTWQMAPGPDNMLVMSRGVGQGRRVALQTVIGMTLGAGAVQLPLLAFGIASIVRSSPLVFELLRWTGAFYLIWLGTKLLLARNPIAIAGGGAKEPVGLAAVREGMLANLTNPSAMLFMLGFLPQFVDPTRGSVATQLLLLGATQKVTGFAILGTMALASGAIGSWLGRFPGFALWQRRLAGLVMVGLGLRLLFVSLGGRPALRA
jgi:threonine/homoserine/homoserine lactone efflux protein